MSEPAVLYPTENDDGEIKERIIDAISTALQRNAHTILREDIESDKNLVRDLGVDPEYELLSIITEVECQCGVVFMDQEYDEKTGYSQGFSTLGSFVDAVANC